jgi:hypothetical protein
VAVRARQVAATQAVSVAMVALELNGRQDQELTTLGVVVAVWQVYRERAQRAGRVVEVQVVST